MNISPETLEEMYRKMIQIRMFEERVEEAYKRGLVPGFAHLYIGQEAVAVGVCQNLESGDYITSTHRGHGHCIAKGASMDRMMAEILGRRTGYCKGKGGTMHVADVSVGVLGANGIVGAGIPIATGAALAIKMQEGSQVVACFFGEDASNQGVFHESLNLASLWKLPIVYICENNLYGISVHQSQQMATKDVAQRAYAYVMPGEVVDGNDVLAVYYSAGQAIQRARKGEGPSLLECKTYRWRGHHVGDSGLSYRTGNEIKSWMKHCPISRLEKLLEDWEVLDRERMKHLKEEVFQEVEQALAFAEGSPLPDPAEALDDIYA